MLVMIAMDRFQAVCYPMTNRVWKPSQSNLKIVAAWTIALVSTFETPRWQFRVTR
jgi:hypothetical protein